jgi:hypothetical protein
MNNLMNNNPSNAYRNTNNYYTYNSISVSNIYVTTTAQQVESKIEVNNNNAVNMETNQNSKKRVISETEDLAPANDQPVISQPITSQIDTPVVKKRRDIEKRELLLDAQKILGQKQSTQPRSTTRRLDSNTLFAQSALQVDKQAVVAPSVPPETNAWEPETPSHLTKELYYLQQSFMRTNNSTVAEGSNARSKRVTRNSDVAGQQSSVQPTKK